MSEDLATGGFGVYVHWPFCRAKCPYCDFNSHVRHSEPDALGFASGLTSEISAFGRLASTRRVTSVFFGGGTPSLMPPLAVEKVLAAIDRHWGLPAAAEVTLEANPTSAEARNFRGYRAAGVNRLSVGVQSLVDADLRILGRQHTAAEALAAFHLAAATFPRVSFDLIYGRPGQTAAHWRNELLQALKEQQGHMSLYQLTIEPGTRFWDLHRNGSLVLPCEDDCAAMFDLTQELTDAAGLDAYEISNHARSGHESQHNVLYWRYGEYAGLGPGAHSRIICDDGQRVAIVNEPYPETWRAAVEARGHGRHEMTHLSRSEEATELLLMGMRLSEGVSMGRYAQLAGAALPAALLDELSRDGLVDIDDSGSRLWATAKGRRVLNALTATLAASVG